MKRPKAQTPSRPSVRCKRSNRFARLYQVLTGEPDTAPYDAAQTTTPPNAPQSLRGKT